MTFPNDAVTMEQLQKIMPNAGKNARHRFSVERMLTDLNNAMHRYEINTPLRKAAFLAQLAHESGELRYLEELASGDAYEGKANLGNVVAGDGRRFKGRGFIQLTGRANYIAATNALTKLGYDVNLVANPELAADSTYAALIAGWFWSVRGLNQLADEGRFDSITRRINGGLNGKADRDKYYKRAKEVFCVT